MAKRKNSSIYDEFYTRVDNKWTCKHCTRFSKTIDTVKNGTNSLKTHLETHHQKQLKDYQEKSKSNVLPPPTKKPKMAEKKVEVETMRQTKIDEPALRETSDPKSRQIDQAIMKLLAAAALPITLVDHPAFRRLMRLMDSRYHLRSRKYFGETLLTKCYDNVKEKIKNVLIMQQSITIVLDEWSNEAQTHSLIGISAHYLDENYENKHFVLAARTLKKSKDDEENETITSKKKKKLHSAENMARIVKEVLIEYGIDEAKVFIILRDGASSVVKLCKLLDKKSSYCFAHLLQLVIKDALKNVKDFDQLLKRIKKFINKLRKSYKLADAFKDAQFLENLPELVLQRGIEVRWSSLYMMLNSFIENKEAIKRVIDEEDLDEFSKHEWETMKNVRDSLSVFCEATTMIQGRDASISLVLPYNAALQANVQKNILKSIGHKELNEELLSNLKKRFDLFKLDQTYVTATLLNPSYKQNNPLNKSMKDLYIEQLLDEICSAEKDTEPLMNIPRQQQAEVVPITTCFLDELKESDEEVYESEELKTKKQIIRGQLEDYFKEPAIPFKASAANYWRINGRRLGYIAALYRKYGTAPATSAEVERLFSLAGNIVTDLRKRLAAEKVEKLLFLNANLPLLDD